MNAPATARSDPHAIGRDTPKNQLNLRNVASWTDGQTDWWTDGRTNERTDGRTRIFGRADICADGRTGGRTDRRTDGRTGAEGRTDGWTDGRMDGRTDGLMKTKHG